MQAISDRIPTYLYRRSNVYYFRKRIPPRIAHLFPVKEIRLSLSVFSVKLAIRKAGLLNHQTELLFELVRQLANCCDEINDTKDQAMPVLTENKIRELVVRFYKDTKRDVEKSWLERKFPDKASFINEVKTHEAVFNELREDLYSNQLGDFGSIVEEFLRSQGITKYSVDDTLFRSLCRKCFAASIRATKETLKGLSEPFANIDDYLNFQVPEGGELQEKPIGELVQPEYTLSQAVHDYVDEVTRLGNWNKKSKLETISNFEILMEILGPSMPVKSIKKNDLIRVKDVLIRFPAHRSKHRRFRDKTVDEILKMKDIQPMAPKTVNNYLIRFCSLFGWLHKRGEIDQNPASRLAIRLKKNPRDQRAALSKDELRKMVKFLYRDPIHPERYWIPLLGMYTGARLNELCQLDVADIVEIENVWCISINNKNGDPKKAVKTKYAVRDIPIHQNLIKLGFFEYVKQRIDSNTSKLWDLKFDDREGYKRSVSRWFNRIKSEFIDPEGNGKKDFHSLRHAFISAHMNNNIEESVVGQLVGHYVPSITYGRYGKGFPIKILKEAIDKLNYDGIECGENEEYRRTQGL